MYMGPSSEAIASVTVRDPGIIVRMAPYRKRQAVGRTTWRQ
jgi:hypothetical protein